jgi:hypothetical protein
MCWQQWRLELKHKRDIIYYQYHNDMKMWIKNRWSAFCQDGITFGVYKLDNNVILENVDFLNCWNSIYPYSLQGALKPFVICGSCLVDSLLLSVISSKQYNVLV